MFWLVALAVLFVSARIARKYKENIPDAVALTFAGLLMIMYLLSFFGGLKAVGAVSAAAVIFVFARMYADSRAGKISFAKEISSTLTLLADPGVICTVLCIAVVGVLTRFQVFTWWDDINY